MANKWVDVSLSDISERIGDGLHGTPTYSDNGEYYFVNGNNLENGEITIKDSTKKVGLEQYLKHKKDLNSNAILVSINGTIGNVALYNGEEVVLGKSACYINLKNNIHRDFVAYVLSSHQFQEYIQRCATGSTIKNVSLKMMRDFSFRMPEDETEQIKAVETLKNLDGKISLNRKSNQTLEQMAQALFKSWFVDFDPVIDNALAADNDIPDELQHKAEQRRQAQKLPDFKPLPDDIRTLFTSEFEQTDDQTVGIAGWIPKGWSAGNLSSLTKFTSNRIDGTELTLDNYISTDNMLPNKGGVLTASKVPDIKTTPSFKPGDILISNIRPYFQKIWFATFSGGRSNDVLGFEANDEQCKEYLLNLLYQDVFFDYMMTTSKGSKMPRGDKKAIMDWSVVIPPSSLQKFFSEHVKNYYKVIPIRNKESEALSMLRDTLLPKLVSGELSLEKNS